MKVGYGRVSATDQNLDTQIEALNKYGVEKIVTEKISGVAEEKELNHLINNFLREGDELVVARMDRLGRNARQLLELIEDFRERGISLVLLDFNVNVHTPGGKMIVSMLSIFAEYERNILKEKQYNGIQIAKQKGVYKGRAQQYTDAAIEDALTKYYSKTHTISEICKLYGFNKTTFYRRKREFESKRQQNAI